MLRWFAQCMAMYFCGNVVLILLHLAFGHFPDQRPAEQQWEAVAQLLVYGLFATWGIVALREERR